MSASASNTASSSHTIEDYDLVVLGCGEGTKYLAWTLARQGKRVAVIERKWIGGACPNMACLPSKNIIHSAKVASYFRRGNEFGMHLEAEDDVVGAELRVDMRTVQGRKRRMVEGLVQMHLDNFSSSGAELIMGTGTFIAPRTIRVDLNEGGTRILRGTDVVIGTGTRASIPDVEGLAAARPLTHIEALDLDELPEHLIILGAGYIGLELAQAMRRLGSEVTLIERFARLLPSVDEDVSAGIAELFSEEKIAVLTDAYPLSVSGESGKSVTVEVCAYEREKGVDHIFKLEGTHILVAAGRAPNTNGLGLDLAGVELSGGYVRVNERLETTAPHTWAIGDVAGSPKFTHISFDDFRIVRDNIAGGNRVTTGRQVPSCLFTDPELASIGLTESEAKRNGIPYRLAKIPMAADLRTRTLSETRGFLKALVEADGDRILGFTGFGVGAGEIMAAVQVAMLGNLPYTALRDAIITHPTLCEGLVALFSKVPPIGKNG
ncbi:dihydrolipoyl dehydrogenase family protein [Acidicapsa dinghuensis]|uniref:Dihydrolipoyl dehydrogenase family protein n=1 Tax=Acidicapsa dinghuensis TaxID=2218256 RepID=A0ABW1EI73_9BACT|nr:FAD-dependent oxidoreductase [Acidicapsa dinghuensis]